MQTIPQTMQAIRSNVTQTVTDLVGAQNQVRALLERPALPTPQADHIGDTLPAMLATVQGEFSATLEAFADLAQFVHGWTTAPAPVLSQSVQDDDIGPIEADAALEPQPLVAPTLAGGPASAAITAADAIASVENLPEPEPEPQPEPDGDDETAHTTNRIAAHLNGYVATGEELATVLESPTVEPAPEEPATSRKGRSRRNKKT